MNPQLMEAMRGLLARYRSISELARRSGKSRESVTKMLKGQSCRVDVVEGFARGLGLDISEWRVLNGYPPLTAEVTESNRPTLLQPEIAIQREGETVMIEAKPTGPDAARQQYEQLAEILRRERNHEREVVRLELLPANHWVEAVRLLFFVVGPEITLTAEDLPERGMSREEIDRRVSRLGQRAQKARNHKMGRRGGSSGNKPDGGSPEAAIAA